MTQETFISSMAFCQALAVDQIMWTSCAEEALNQVEAGDAEAGCWQCPRYGGVILEMGMANGHNMVFKELYIYTHNIHII